MSMMLKGLMAIRPLKPVIKINKDVTKMNRSQRRKNCQEQLSTVVKMNIDGFSYQEIMDKTKVSRSFVFSTRDDFDFVRPKTKENKVKIVDLIAYSKNYTYTVKSLSNKTGVDKKTIKSIIGKTPQIERGKEKGLKHYYKYNFDIVLGSGPIARGSVY